MKRGKGEKILVNYDELLVHFLPDIILNLCY